MSTMEQGTWRAGRFWWDSSRPGEAGERRLESVVFDLDALTDVECGGHRLAFNAAFAAHGLSLRWSVQRYRKLLALSDERQRVAAELRARNVCTECDVLAKLLVDEICATKAMVVDEMMLDADLSPRVGLVDLVTDAFTAGVAVGIVSSGRRQWVQPLVRQLVGDGLVQTIVTADDVGKSVPNREAYHLALAELGAHARDSLAFSGSPAGQRIAASVGLASVLVDPDAAGARADYDGLRVTDCHRLQGRLWAAGKGSAAA
jgi:beta-phosphoglucomutase-like phosphatase (HAD superfamily)